MAIDRDKLRDLLKQLGKALKKPTTLCLIGSAPGILAGQTDRFRSNINVWLPKSNFDYGDLLAACQHVGIFVDPTSNLSASDVYIQLMSQGIVALPKTFELQTLERFGNLEIFSPPPALLVASKLVRALPHDIEDLSWWMQHQSLTRDAIDDAIHSLPHDFDVQMATNNFARTRSEIRLPVSRSVRALHVDALATLMNGKVSTVMKARDWELLREVARLAQEDAPHDLAFTDPALFRAWREAVTKFHLAGYSSMTPQRVDEVTGPKVAAE